jgi:hypothetical protein
MTRYRLTDTYDPNGDLYTLDEALEMFKACFGERVFLHETPDGRLVIGSETNHPGTVIGYAA